MILTVIDRKERLNNNKAFKSVQLEVIHLTTHRLAFHASLLASRPDLASSNDTLKAGPAILPRKGWKSKSRIWLA
jgi:sterol 3beta-glucosyltransferase